MISASVYKSGRILRKARVDLAEARALYKKEPTAANLNKVKSAGKICGDALINYKVNEKMFDITKKKTASSIVKSFNAIEEPGMTIKEFTSLIAAPFRDVYIPDQITLGPFTAKPLRTDEEIKSMTQLIANKDIESKLCEIGLPSPAPWEKRERDPILALFDNGKPMGMAKIKRYEPSRLDRASLLVKCNLSKRSVLVHRCLIAYALLNPKAFGLSAILRSKIKPLLDSELQFTPEVISASFPKTVVDFYNTKLGPFKTRIGDIPLVLKVKWPVRFTNSPTYEYYFSRTSMLRRFTNLETFLAEVNKPENINKL